MEAEHLTAARMEIEAICESCFHPGTLIQKWHGSDKAEQVWWEAFAVILGLDFHVDEKKAFFP
jgi:hypothetical protein